MVEGFGRGSSQMGVPTANIEPGPLKDRLEGLPLGVYFGWVYCHWQPFGELTRSATAGRRTPRHLHREGNIPLDAC